MNTKVPRRKPTTDATSAYLATEVPKMEFQICHQRACAVVRRWLEDPSHHQELNEAAGVALIVEIRNELLAARASVRAYR